jgi:hypothetical protein
MASADDAIDQLKSQLPHSSTGRFSRADLERRLEHFVRETARGAARRGAFATPIATPWADCALIRNARRRTCSATRFPKRSRWRGLARQVGAFASSSFRAGFRRQRVGGRPVADARHSARSGSELTRGACPRRHRAVVRGASRARRDEFHCAESSTKMPLKCAYRVARATRLINSTSCSSTRRHRHAAFRLRRTV